VPTRRAQCAARAETTRVHRGSCRCRQHTADGGAGTAGKNLAHWVEVDGGEMFNHACELGIEGVVSKVRDSRYISGRGNNWVKKTCAQRETPPIAGFALKQNKFDGIYVGRLKGNDLVYAAKVDHGFDTASAKDLQARLKPLIRKTQPYAKKIAHRGVWVEPSLLAEIEYRAKSAEGKVRHPFYKGLREDL
jgi:bifunctional non-homologous end joining protein LigD